MLEHCNAGGTAYQTLQNCSPGKCHPPALACAQCLVATDCPAPSNECLTATCSSLGACSTTPVAAGVSCGSGGVCSGAGQCGVCVPGITRCVGSTQETCSGVGQWGSAVGCPFLCLSGACSGVCVPGAKRCSAGQPEACDAGGQWKSAGTCAGATPSCHDGACEPATPASCAALSGACGPAQSGYCCSSTAIAGGTFLRGYDAVTYTDAGFPATVADFRLDRYEVSVARFRAFVAAGQGTAASAPAAGAGQNPSVAGTGWQASWNSKLSASTAALKSALACHASYATFTDQPGSNDARPINCVTWYDAFAFCIWDGARLPTEAEWNLAAAGGSEQRVYPWSAPPTQTTVDPTYASYYVDAVSQCFGDGAAGCAITDLLPVGSLPKGVGRFGNYELAGNVWEWAFDPYANPYPMPCSNCVATSGSARAMRGGSFFGNPSTILASARSFATADQRLFSVGIRCAR